MRMDDLERLQLRGDGIDIAADADGPAGGMPVIFLHGSGQSRGSWRKAVAEAARRGFRAIAYDLRGHGETDWSPDGLYSLERNVADLEIVVDQLGGNPAVVGTSAGATTAMIAAARPGSTIDRVVLIDVSPTPELAGIAEVRAFMGSARNGFASLEEAADAVAAYLPQRPRPKDASGLARNLRMRDGRYFWHWDPEVFFQMSGEPVHVDRSIAAMKEAAKHLSIPVLYVRGGRSSVVSEEGAREFLKLVPHAEYADIAGAHHMVAGDANDAFNEAIFDFIDRSAGSRSLHHG